MNTSRNDQADTFATFLSSLPGQVADLDFQLTEPEQKTSSIRAKKSIKELGIFAIGVGVILMALTVWLNFTMTPHTPAASGMTVPMSVSILLVVLGALVVSTKSPVVIRFTIMAIVLGLGADLLIGFNIVKSLISGYFIWVVIDRGRSALEAAELLNERTEN